MKKRVTIPVRDVKAMLDLAMKVQARHTADGANSVLNPLNWKSIGSSIDDAIVLHEKAERAKRDMLEAYQQRDLKVDNILTGLRASRDILTGIYCREMKVLGQWGFEVLERRSSKTEASEANPLKIAS